MRLLFIGSIGLFGLSLGFRPANTDDALQTKVALGERLFFDPILSADRTISCTSCHKPEFAFANTATVSRGVGGQLGDRNTPSAMNLAGRIHFFWDGRASSLEMQALQPIAASHEMNLPMAEAVIRLEQQPVYASAFRQFFKAKPGEKTLAEALGAYERTLETSNRPTTDISMATTTPCRLRPSAGGSCSSGKPTAPTAMPGKIFTADRFKNVGLYDGKKLTDAGRFRITGDSTQMGRFKVPGLRNVAVTAPYMHNSMFKTLRQVLDYYNQPDAIVTNGHNRDLSLSTPLHLSETELTDLESFRNALNDDWFAKSLSKKP